MASTLNVSTNFLEENGRNFIDNFYLTFPFQSVKSKKIRMKNKFNEKHYNVGETQKIHLFN